MIKEKKHSKINEYKEKEKKKNRKIGNKIFNAKLT